MARDQEALLPEDGQRWCQGTARPPAWRQLSSGPVIPAPWPWSPLLGEKSLPSGRRGLVGEEGRGPQGGSPGHPSRHRPPGRGLTPHGAGCGLSSVRGSVGGPALTSVLERKGLQGRPQPPPQASSCGWDWSGGSTRADQRFRETNFCLWRDKAHPGAMGKSSCPQGVLENSPPAAHAEPDLEGRQEAAHTPHKKRAFHPGIC